MNEVVKVEGVERTEGRERGKGFGGILGYEGERMSREQMGDCSGKGMGM